MLNKLFIYILSLPYRIIYKIYRELSVLTYNSAKFITAQNELFFEINLDRSSALEKLYQIRKQNNLPQMPMASEHEVIFSALSLRYKPKKILEIGTYDGSNALLLSHLFQDSIITTIDLPDDDNLFKDTYNRNDPNFLSKFISYRNTNLNKSQNIKFQQFNSIELYKKKEEFDLIWIDGAHGYPYVTIDIINSLRLINQNGIIMCDDIWKTKPFTQDKIYTSVAAKETLDVLAENSFLNNYYFFKRLDKKNNSVNSERKYISLSFKKDK